MMELKKVVPKVLEGSEEGVEDGSCDKVGLDVGRCVVGTSPVPGEGCKDG